MGGANSVWADDVVSATQTITNNGKTSTWTSITATVAKNSSCAGNGLYFVAGSDGDISTSSGTVNIKSGRIMYIQVPSAYALGSLKITGSDNYDGTISGKEARTVALNSGSTIAMNKTNGKSANFVAGDIEYVNNGYYVKLTSNSDFKFTEVSVTLTSSDSYNPSLTGGHIYEKIYIGKGDNTFTPNTADNYLKILKGSSAAVYNTDYTMSYALTSGNTVSVNTTNGTATSSNTLGQSVVTATVTPKGETADTYTGFTFPFTYVVTDRKSNETGVNGLTALDKAWTWTPEDVAKGRYYQDYHAGDEVNDYIFVKSSDTGNNGVRAKLQSNSQIAFKLGAKMDVTIFSNKVSDRHLVISTADNANSVVQSGNDNVLSHTFILEAGTYYIGAKQGEGVTQLYVQSIQFTPHVDKLPADFTYGYTSWTSSATDEMTITIPAHKAGQDFNVTVNPGTYSLGTIDNGSKSGNTVTITAPVVGSTLTVTVPVTDGVTTTNYQIVVTTETATGTTFDEKTRYSKLLIEARKNDFYSNTNSGGLGYGSNLDYVPGLVAKAMIDAVDYHKDHQNSEITNDLLASWYNSVKTYGSKSIATNGTDGKNFDDLNATKIYFGLKKVAASGKVTGIEAYSDANTKLSSALTGIKNANTSYSISSSHASYPISIADMQGGWWHKADYINQMWGDGQYMGTALLAQLINDKDVYDANNESKRVTANDWDVVANQIKIYHKYAWDSSVNLPHHAFAADKGTNSTSHSDTWKMDGDTYHNEGIWGRAAGWYFMALVDVLEQMPSSHADYNTIKGYLSDVAAGLKARQDATTGCWYQLPLYDHTFSAAQYNNSAAQPGRVYNYLESSATALYTAAYFKAIRLGLLDKATYEATAKKAYKGIIENFMSTDNHLYWCCKSAGLGGKGDNYKAGGSKFRDGSNAYYLKGNDVAPTKPDSYTEGKVLGAFIMAAIEYERLYLEEPVCSVFLASDGNGTVSAVYTDGGAAFTSGDKVAKGTRLTITATPNPGYKFDTSIGKPWGTATDLKTNPLEGFEITDNKTFTAHFAPVTPPTISAQPVVSAEYERGASATALSVTASSANGGILAYQWYSNTANTTVGGQAIDGATNSSYTPVVDKVGTTYYYCVVTETLAEGGSGIATSGVAKIVVKATCTHEHTGVTIGNTDQTTPYRGARSEAVAINKGETKKFRFTNHGNIDANYNNWNLVIATADSKPTGVEAETEELVLRADNYGWGPMYNAPTFTPTVTDDWDAFRTDMQNAEVEVTVVYNANGTMTINAVSEANSRTYTETETTKATEGQKYIYFVVDQSHITNYRELIPVRAVISGGTLNSITVNDAPIASPQNNTDYFVEPNAKVVVSATATSGYYFKNWSVTGTAGDGRVNGESNVYTISNINGTPTTVKAKYEVKGNLTVPAPENATCDQAEGVTPTSFTVAPFSSSQAGTEQTIALHLPEYATATVKSGSAGTINGDNLTITAPASNSNGSTIIVVTAHNGTTQAEYTINYSTSAAPAYTYTVNAVDGSSNVLATIATGEASSAVVAYPEYILKNGVLYGITKNGSGDWFRKTVNPNTANFVENITYSVTQVSNVVFYIDGEDIAGWSKANNTQRASKGQMGYGTKTEVTTLAPGTYIIGARGVNGNNATRNAIFTVGDKEVYNLEITTNVDIRGYSKSFTVTKDTKLYVSCDGSSISGLDWFYVQKSAVLDVAENGQVYLLSNELASSDAFFATQSNDWAERTIDSKKFNLYKLDGSSRYETLTVKGAKAFEIITQNGSSSDRTYKVNIGNTEISTVTAEANSLSSSGIIATGHDGDEITIKLHTTTGGTVYPYQIIFYTEKPKATLVQKEITCLTTASGAKYPITSNNSGSITMTTLPSAVADYATVEFTNNTLTVTSKKAGTVNLEFSIAANGAYAAGTSTLQLNIRKENLTMTITPEEYVWNKTTTPDMPAYTHPTVVLKGESGNEVKGLTLKYTSDDHSMVQVDKNTGVITSFNSESQGSANVYATFAGNDQYNSVEGVFTATITAGYEVRVGSSTTTPTLNQSFALKGKNDETLVNYTFGGWKYNDGGYSTSSDKTDSWNAAAQQKDTAPIDGYSYAITGSQDAVEETKNPSVSPIYGSTRLGWFQVGKPFSLPVRGSYMTFEPTKNGTITIYILQNGAWNTKAQTVDGRTKNVIVPGEFRPHAFYIVNQAGVPVQTFAPESFSVVTKQKVTDEYKCIMDRNHAEYNDASNIGKWQEFNTYFSEEEQAKIYAAWNSGTNDAQKIIELDNHAFLAIQKGIVKYTFHAVAGQTYYMFSNFSKLGFSGINFVEDETQGAQPTVELTIADDANNYNVTKESAPVIKVTEPQYKSITYTRNFTAGQWTSLCLPFYMSPSEVEANFGSGTQIITFDGADDSDDVLTFHFVYHEIQSILPGYPYLIKPTKTVESITVNNKIAYPADATGSGEIREFSTSRYWNRSEDVYRAEDDGQPYTFVGSYNGAPIKDGSVYCNNAGSLQRLKSGNTDGLSYPPFRAFLRLNEVVLPQQHALSKSFSISMGGIVDDSDDNTATLLDELLIDDSSENDLVKKHADGIYNLNGQKMNSMALPKGIYIINGKKYNVK